MMADEELDALANEVSLEAWTQIAAIGIATGTATDAVGDPPAGR